MARQCEHCGNEIREGLKLGPQCGKTQGNKTETSCKSITAGNTKIHWINL